MTYDPKRDPIALHPLYPLMQGVLRVLNSTAYYDSGRWVMDRDEVLTLVETAFKHKMERLDDDLILDNPRTECAECDCEHDDRGEEGYGINGVCCSRCCVCVTCESDREED